MTTGVFAFPLAPATASVGISRGRLIAVRVDSEHRSPWGRSTSILAPLILARGVGRLKTSRKHKTGSGADGMAACGSILPSIATKSAAGLDTRRARSRSKMRSPCHVSSCVAHAFQHLRHRLHHNIVLIRLGFKLG